MGRRDADERPPIEIWGAEPEIGSTQHVELRPQGTGRSRARILAAAALIGGLLVGGLMLGGGDEAQPELPAADDDEVRDNSDHIELGARRTSTTEAPRTSTTMPTGPPFGEPVEGVIVMPRFGTQWTRLDLSTGRVNDVTLPAAELTAVAMPGGLVIPSPSGEMRYYPLLDGAAEPEGIVLGRGSQAVRAGPDMVWLFEQPLSSEETTTRATLVDLRGEVRRQLEVEGFQGMATPEHIVVSRGGRVYTFDGQGFRPIATGYANGVVGDDVVVTACDDDARCTLRVQPTDGGGSRALLDLEDPDMVFYEPPSMAEDGRFAIIAHGRGPDDQHLLVFDRDGELVTDVVVGTGQRGGLPQWLPGDLGLLVSTSSGITWVRPADPEWVAEDLPYEPLSGSPAFFVVTP